MTLTQEEAHRLFEYKDGVLYWRVRPAMCKRIGDTVGGTNGVAQPYLRGRYKQHRFMVHQVIFLMHHNYVPETIDHIDGNIQNNAIENLRDVTKSQNACNQKPRKNNTSGHRCVTWNEKYKRWIVSISLKGKKRITKYCKDFELACLVADEARDLLHGKYAYKGALNVN